MKYFLTEQWDNDYNAFIETYIICAKDINEARDIAASASWSGHTFTVKQETNWFIAQYFKHLNNGDDNDVQQTDRND